MLTTAKSTDDVRRGENIILGGLGIQVLFFGFFIVVTMIFHRRIARAPTPKSLRTAAPWRKLLCALYATSMLIMVRSIYRVAEYAEGQGGELQSKEFWLYIFDALPMVVVAYAFIWMHPSKVVNSRLQTPAMEPEYAMEDGLGGRTTRQRSDYK
jgi:hypothetical protein